MGDFVDTAGRPTPMKEHEIEKMLIDSRKPEDQPTIKLVFQKGEHVTIKEGPFAGYEGTGGRTGCRRRGWCACW